MRESDFSDEVGAIMSKVKQFQSAYYVIINCNKVIALQHSTNICNRVRAHAQTDLLSLNSQGY